ncbi:hypothetical protein DXG01_017177, partial [Tephrocybe rancida]
GSVAEVEEVMSDDEGDGLDPDVTITVRAGSAITMAARKSIDSFEGSSSTSSTRQPFLGGNIPGFDNNVIDAAMKLMNQQRQNPLIVSAFECDADTARGLGSQEVFGPAKVVEASNALTNVAVVGSAADT